MKHQCLICHDQLIIDKLSSRLYEVQQCLSEHLLQQKQFDFDSPKAQNRTRNKLVGVPCNKAYSVEMSSILKDRKTGCPKDSSGIRCITIRAPCVTIWCDNYVLEWKYNYRHSIFGDHMFVGLLLTKPIWMSTLKLL